MFIQFLIKVIILKEQKNKKNIITEKNSFEDIIKSTNNSDLTILNFKKKCISPGYYSKHLLKWMNEFDPKQFLIVESEVFKNEPIKNMKRIQEFLKVKKMINYEEVLKKDKELTYCLKKDVEKCTSFDKKPAIDQKTYHLLENIYSESNKKLNELLGEYRFKKPKWLDEIDKI